MKIKESDNLRTVHRDIFV